MKSMKNVMKSINNYVLPVVAGMYMASCSLEDNKEQFHLSPTNIDLEIPKSPTVLIDTYGKKGFDELRQSNGTGYFYYDSAEYATSDYVIKNDLFNSSKFKEFGIPMSDSTLHYLREFEHVKASLEEHLTNDYARKFN